VKAKPHQPLRTVGLVDTGHVKQTNWLQLKAVSEKLFEIPNHLQLNYHLEDSENRLQGPKEEENHKKDLMTNYAERSPGGALGAEIGGS